MIRASALLLAVLVAGCSPAAPPPTGGTVAAAAPESPPPSLPSPSPSPPSPPGLPPDPPAAPADPPLAGPPAVTAAAVLDVLYPDTPPPAGVVAACPVSQPDAARIPCLLRARFEGHPEEGEIAAGLYARSGHILGVERAWVMDGGFRGTIQIVPELPVGRYRRQLDWITAAMDDLEAFFGGIGARAPRPLAYRWRALAFRFLRSVGRTTPSAYAEGWTVGWNVLGSLHRSGEKVRETLFHELFHLNDSAHGDWTRANLSGPFQQIVSRCGTNRACLQPWAPSQTTVRGGTYYAFQPDNGEGFHEYGAELALRWYREQRAVLRGERPTGRSFKCGPEPNGRVWNLLADEFFGGVDLVPGC